MSKLEKSVLEARIRQLALSFPSLKNAPGIDPWDVGLFEKWAYGMSSSGERQSSLFVLAVWNRHDYGETILRPKGSLSLFADPRGRETKA